MERPPGTRVQDADVQPETARHRERGRARRLERRRDEQARTCTAPAQRLELLLEKMQALLLDERDAEERVLRGSRVARTACRSERSLVVTVSTFTLSGLEPRSRGAPLEDLLVAPPEKLAIGPIGNAGGHRDLAALHRVVCLSVLPLVRQSRGCFIQSRASKNTGVATMMLPIRYADPGRVRVLLDARHHRGVARRPVLLPKRLTP